MYDAAHVVKDANGLITGAQPDTNLLTVLVWVQVIYVTMVYGPIAAFLVEYFRAKVRYTSLSIPYHFGNGWFGGMLPLLFTALVGATTRRGASPTCRSSPTSVGCRSRRIGTCARSTVRTIPTATPISASPTSSRSRS